MILAEFADTYGHGWWLTTGRPSPFDDHLPAPRKIPFPAVALQVPRVKVLTITRAFGLLHNAILVLAYSSKTGTITHRERLAPKPSTRHRLSYKSRFIGRNLNGTGPDYTRGPNPKTRKERLEVVIVLPYSHPSFLPIQEGSKFPSFLLTPYELLDERFVVKRPLVFFV